MHRATSWRCEGGRMRLPCEARSGRGSPCDRRAHATHLTWAARAAGEVGGRHWRARQRLWRRTSRMIQCRAAAGTPPCARSRMRGGAPCACSSRPRRPWRRVRATDAPPRASRSVPPALMASCEQPSITKRMKLKLMIIACSSMNRASIPSVLIAAVDDALATLREADHRTQTFYVTVGSYTNSCPVHVKNKNKIKIWARKTHKINMCRI